MAQKRHTTTLLSSLLAQSVKTLVAYIDLRVLSLACLGASSLFGKVDKPKAVEISDLGLHLLPIAAGEFQMGDDRVANTVKPYEGERKVRFTKPFLIGETEVTQKAWESIMGFNPSNFKGPLLPVEQVDWKQAADFCQKLTMRESKAGRLPAGKVYRLPSEAEWEYAALAGSTTIYFFGNDPRPLKAYAWHNLDADGRTHKVGLKQPNKWGLRDIYGNVREWCLDGYSPRPKGSLVDPVIGPQNPDKVNRGGSYDSCPECCKTSRRTSYGPGYQSSDVGFRLVLGHSLQAAAP
ncbi:MAG: formylglycine-generating enzyme family protein [Verrucomicrobia bacterium]|nr:formylglycine-generating enzyme family protein [Verrucomicrobiota bacterium]MDA1046618.1 formylglycine-generating enzyme family protein [Verrucomicrobiota bacterium]